MKKKLLILLGLFCLSETVSATIASVPNQKSMKLALEKYLAEQGNFCLGKFNWPIDISEAEFAMKTRDAVQMPVLEKLGLVVGSNAEAMRKVGDSDLSVPVKRYALTDAGQKFYMQKQVFTKVDGKNILHTHDLCAGKLSLYKLAGWSKPEKLGNSEVTTAAYSFKIKAAKWARDPDIQKVFPILAIIVNGEGSLQLKQQFRWSNGAWAPVYPWDN